MVGAVLTFGDLIHWHSHIHAIVPEGVFTDTGHFVHIPDILKHRAADSCDEYLNAPITLRNLSWQMHFLHHRSYGTQIIFYVDVNP
jgi:hypothetical protein